MRDKSHTKMKSFLSKIKENLLQLNHFPSFLNQGKAMNYTAVTVTEVKKICGKQLLIFQGSVAHFLVN